MFDRGRCSSQGPQLGACFVAVALIACSATGGTAPDAAAGGSGGGGSGAAARDGGYVVQFPDALPDDQIATIVIDPPQATLTVAVGGVPAMQAFTVRATTADGRSVDASGGAWSFERPDLATIAQTGALTTTGFAGGVAKVGYAVGGVRGQATVTIKLTATHLVGADPAAEVKQTFPTATEADASVTKLLYPYDGTVFPRGLDAPVIQWQGGKAGDVYLVHIEGPTFSLDAYVTPATQPPSYALPPELWRKLTDSSAGPVTITVQRHDAATGKTFKGIAQTWTIAPVNLKGSIYYTQLVRPGTNVMRLHPGSGQVASTFLADTETCAGCHSISANGRRIVASLNGGDSQWAVWDAATGKREYRSKVNSGFMAISPDGEWVLARHWTAGSPYPSDGFLVLSKWNDSTEVGRLTLPTGVTGGPSHPVFSPEGQSLAFSVRTAGDGLAFTASSLWIADVAGTPPTFGNPRKLADGLTGGWGVATYPSFSPNGKWIAFQRSQNARSDSGLGRLALISIDGTSEIELANANGKGVIAEADQNYIPSFHPLEQGGYLWLAFSARRPYGNQGGEARGQIWMAAVDATIKPGVDPSHPAFHVEGQNMSAINERPQFTLDPCKKLGQSCEAGYDCCDGFCRAEGDSGGPVCVAKPPGCSMLDETCATSADCCAGLACTTMKVCRRPTVD